MSGVTPAKRDLLVGVGDQSVVGDGYAMGVTAQIAEYMLRPSERWFRVDHPVLSEQWSQPGRKGFRLSEELQVSMKVEPAVVNGALECRDELAAKDATENFDRKKKGVAWFAPAGAIGRESTCRHHAMHMRVKFEFLTPGVQHAEEADLCAKMFGIAGNFAQCFCTGSEQEIVDDLSYSEESVGLTGEVA
jgi:hypothetical protein